MNKSTGSDYNIYLSILHLTYLTVLTSCDSYYKTTYFINKKLAINNEDLASY